MKEKTFNFSVETDVNSIECDVYCAQLIFAAADDGKFTVEYPRCKNVSAGSGDGTIIINQRRRAPFGHRKQKIKIFVPEHTVPALKIYGKHLALEMSGGIYGELNLIADDGYVTFSGCSVQSAEITGGDLTARLADVTVKGNLVIKCDHGEVVTENSFATRFECRTDKGNIGQVNLSCKDSAFDTLKGNITVTLDGCAEDFNTDILAGEGTVNRESEKHEGAEGSFHAYTKKGNIVLDFNEEKQKENA